MTARLPFTELAVRRAIRAARKEGVPVNGITIRGDGTITVYHSDQNDFVMEPGAVNRIVPSSEFEDFEA